MRLNTVITFGASIACAGLAVFLARGWIDEAVREVGAAAPLVGADTAPAYVGVPVLVAGTQLSFGDNLSPDALMVVDYPEESVPDGALDSVKAALSEPGARVVALTRINAGEPILDYKISLPGSRAVLAQVLTPGMRAATIRVSDVEGVAGFVLPGDRVDVVFVRDEEGDSQYGLDMQADILLQGVKVLGINQIMDDQVQGAMLGTTVTLEVDLDDAQKLALAGQVGTLSLVLRPIGDESVETVGTVNRKRLVKAPLKPVAAKPRRPRSPKPKTGEPVAKVTVVRGEERESVAVIRERTDTNAQLAGSLAGETP